MARISVAWLMGLVGIVALGLAAMRAGSYLAWSVAMGTMLLGLSVSSVAAMVRPSPAASWRGFAAFGWIYFGLTFFNPGFSDIAGHPFPFLIPVILVGNHLHPQPTAPPKPTNPIVLRIQFDEDGRPSIPMARSTGGPTTSELGEARRYHEARIAYDHAVVVWSEATEFAFYIGLASMTLAFGLLGAIVGQMMAPGALRSNREPDDLSSSPSTDSPV